MAKQSPTVSSLNYWRRKGAIVCKAEHWVPSFIQPPQPPSSESAYIVHKWFGEYKAWLSRRKIGVRRDLFGFIDIVVLWDSHIIAVQSTGLSRDFMSNLNARTKKIMLSEECSYAAHAWLLGMGKIVIEGWHKPGHRWEAKRVEITLSDDRLVTAPAGAWLSGQEVTA